MNHGSEQYQLLPALAADDFERLKSDIAERGVLVPIEVDESGNVLDGHHRKRIADELGIDCPTVTRIGMAEHEKRLHAVALNLARRHLTDAQKVALGMTIEPDVAEEARRRQGTRSDLTSGTNDPEVERTRDEVARQVGLGSGRTYERAKATIAKAEKVAPQVAEKAKAGELTMREVAKEVRAAEKAQKVAEIRSRPVPKVDAEGPWPVIYADPPWRYEHAEPSRSLDNQYPTMTLEVWHNHDDGRRTKGWARLPLRCHYLAYIYKSDACGLLISFHLMQRALATHYDEWRAKATARRDGFRWVEARNTSYVTVSIAVPTDVLLAAMNEEVGFGLAEAA